MFKLDLEINNLCKMIVNIAGPKPVRYQKPVSTPPVVKNTSSPVVPGKKRSVARKSTTGSNQSNQSPLPSQGGPGGDTAQASKWEAPWLKKRLSSAGSSAGAKKSRGKERGKIMDSEIEE